MSLYGLFNKSFLVFVVLTLLVISNSIYAKEQCFSKKRVVYDNGQIIPIYVAPNKWPELIIENKTIHATLPDNPEGLDIRSVNLSDRVFFNVEDPKYRGNVLVHTTDGKSIHFVLVGQSKCADLSVTVADDNEQTEITNDSNRSRVRQRGLRLVDMMYIGGDMMPSGFRREIIGGTKNERLIFKQGSVFFYLKEIWHGNKTNGIIILVENQGRTPYRVAIESIDYGSPQLIKTLGIVRELTMMPTTRRLGPAPEFAIDQLHPTHQGLIFIESEKVKNVRNAYGR